MNQQKKKDIEYSGISEQNKIAIFVICCAMAGVMALMAFTSFPVWYAGFAVTFATAAFILRPRRSRSKDSI